MTSPQYMSGLTQAQRKEQESSMNQRMTAAQEREQEQCAVNATMIHEGAAGLKFGDLCNAFEAIMNDRPDVDPWILARLGNVLGRHADKVERESR